jgi:RNA polymerase sigma-70 factor (ECF subfamily)
VTTGGADAASEQPTAAREITTDRGGGAEGLHGNSSGWACVADTTCLLHRPDSAGSLEPCVASGVVAATTETGRCYTDARQDETRDADAEAVHLARSGDLDAYDVLVTRHTGDRAPHRRAARRGRRRPRTVLQTAFVKAFRALDRFRDDAAFRPWLLRIVANETHNLTRSRGVAPSWRSATRRWRYGGKRRRTRQRGRTRGESAPGPRRGAQLPEKDRLVVTYRYLLDLSEAETAAALGWPLGSVKSRTSRALRKLQGAVTGPPLEGGSHG